MVERLYPNVFSPQYIRGIRLKHRVTSRPMHTPKLAIGGMANSPGYIAFNRSRARSGVSVVTLGEVPVNDNNAYAHPFSINAHGVYEARALADVREAIEEYGAIASAELFHAGPYADETVTKGVTPVGPVAHVRPDGVKVRAMTKDDMEQVADEFAHTAATFKAAGYKHLLVHGGSWLLASFFSKVNNTRDDEFGGELLENRMRFPLMVVQRVREVVGEEFILSYKLSPLDFPIVYPDTAEMAKHGMPLIEGVKFANELSKYIDIIDVHFQQRHDLHARQFGLSYGFYPEAHHAFIAEEMKKLGCTAMLQICNSCDRPDVMDKLIGDGVCERITLGRATLADPFLIQKMRDNRPEEIRPCLKCGHCQDPNTARSNKTDNAKMLKFDRGAVHKMRCSINPTLGIEDYPKHLKTDNPKKVCVIGGGPAGCQAAITAADLGHEVVLFEKSDSLGGQIKTYENLWFKDRYRLYVEYLNYQVKKRKINLKLNTEAIPQIVEKEKPDAVIVAIGAEPIILKIPGYDKKQVFEATEITSGEKIEELGDTVVIIGGNMVGCEVALQIIKLYEDKKVILLEKEERLASTMLMGMRIGVMDHLNYNVCHAADFRNITEENKQVKYYVNMEVKEITDNQVIATDRLTGEERAFACDSVIMAVGMRDRHTEAEKFYDCALECSIIGDCAKARDIEAAVNEGYNAAVSLESYI